MNYVGSISILDRGDGPAQAVIDRNARSLAQRIADETKDELEKVMTRVETIYSTFEDSDNLYGHSNLEYLQDIMELEELMKDQVKKKKYQQQVTIFIVGYSDVCGQKLKLMQQVNEFFTENSKKIDEEDWFPTTPDMDLEVVGDKIEESLQVARDLSMRLGELNKEMMEYMSHYAEKKASNKGKKKMEKALGQARDELQSITDKLQSAQTALDEKEEKLQSTFKQLELKNLEAQKFKTAAELAKQKIAILQKELDEQKRTAEDAKKDLAKFHDDQMAALRQVHQQDMDDMKKQHADQIKTLSGVSDSQSEVGKQFDLDSEDGIQRQSSKQESRPSAKAKKGAKSPTRHPPGKDGKGSKGSSAGTGKEYAEMSVQDEGGDPATAQADKVPGTRHSRRSRSTLAPVHEIEGFEDAFDLSDEQSWSSVPKDQLESKFSQYRRLCQHKLREVDEQRQLLVAKTQRKVQLLKSQFVEHKTKWEAERKVLIQQVEQAQQLQTDAEKEADQAMTQLEDFITEQEKLEEEEEVRRSALLGTRSQTSLTPGAKTPQTPLPAGTPAPPTTPHSTSGAASRHPTPPENRNAHNSEELQRLMQQTDDAKVEELKGRLAGTKSAPPEVEMTKTEDIDALKQTLDVEKVEEGEDATWDSKPVVLSDLQDLHEKEEESPPSTLPLLNAANIGSLPAHDPLADTIEGDAADYARGEETVSRGSLKDEASSLDKERTAVTQESGSVTEVSEDKERSQLQEGTSEMTVDGSKAASKTPEYMMKLEGGSEDELRIVSARSRASLRNQYRTQLSESRQAAEERRSKTPVITLPTKLSVDDELVFDDDDDEFDDDMALPDDFKEELEDQKRKDLSTYEMATSPPPGPMQDPSSFSIHFASRKSSSLKEHPLLQEYLKTYNGVANFKDNLSKLFLDKDMMSASQILSDLETLAFNKDQKVMGQVEMFTVNALYVLDEITSVISSAVMVDREPVVSSLLPFSRDETRSRLPPTREASEDTSYPAYIHSKQVTPASASGTDQVCINPMSEPSIAAAEGVPIDTKGSEVAGRMSAPGSLAGGVEQGPRSQPGSHAGSQAGSCKSSLVSGTTKQYLADLQTQCFDLQSQLEEETKKHEDQLRHNTVVMMEMQDTINELQRELSTLGKKKPRSASSTHGAKTPSPDQSLMFTRLDLERNAKIMKKAVLDQRMDVDKYKEVVTTMDDYVSLPAQRLAHLVKKYVHHSRMKEIEENVKNSENLDERVFDTLDKMEALQNQRARQWADKMDTMGLERLRLAAMLMDSLDAIEQESGLFLIKPMYSFRGRELKAPPAQKLARPARSQPVPRQQSAAQASTTSFVPAPTPASHARRTMVHTPTHQVAMETMTYQPPPSRPEDGVVGSHAVRTMVTPQAMQLMHAYPTWNIQASQARTVDNGQLPLNTPRMLELDINRMLIGQNNISSKLPHPPTDDRLVNASNNSLRSYVTVQRPTASLSHADRPHSGNGGRETGAPPSSPSPRPQVPVSPVDREVPHTMSTTPPLPPITDRTGSAGSREADEDPESPTSPPGFSPYVSFVQDDGAALTKGLTRMSTANSATGND